MKLLVKAILIVATTASLCGLNVLANLAWGAEYPNVASLHKFTRESNYMSLPGYLRYLTFVQNGTWISRREAVGIVRQQESTASY